MECERDYKRNPQLGEKSMTIMPIARIMTIPALLAFAFGGSGAVADDVAGMGHAKRTKFLLLDSRII